MRSMQWFMSASSSSLKSSKDLHFALYSLLFSSLSALSIAVALLQPFGVVFPDLSADGDLRSMNDLEPNTDISALALEEALLVLEICRVVSGHDSFQGNGPVRASRRKCASKAKKGRTDAAEPVREPVGDVFLREPLK
jgi:hypothetical protein